MLDFVDGDLFAGGGGASVGSEAALGKAPDFALNHDPVAIDVHEANHPDTAHFRCDVWEPEPVDICAGQRLRHLHASPDCKDHSRAKGGKPKDQKIRSLAWVVVAWARRVKPQVITVENVPEFIEWGPLHKPGTVIDGVDAAGYDLSRAKTKKDQVRLIGNSVCPELQEAIVAAQFPEEAARARARRAA
jgi:DNA (cytosine-5)-methyltransferase 1